MSNTADIEKLSEVFQVLSDPNRLRILELLRKTAHPLCVNVITQRIGVSQSAISQHLKILRQHGLVSVEKEGNFKHYSLSLDNLVGVRSMREAILGREFEI